MIRKANSLEVSNIKKFVDTFEEMDVVTGTFSEEYYKNLIIKGILIVAEEDNEIIGVCFGKYNIKENWADLLGVVVDKDYQKKGIGSNLVKEFEKIVIDKKINLIDLYADKEQNTLFTNLGYKEGRAYISFRKKLN